MLGRRSVFENWADYCSVEMVVEPSLLQARRSGTLYRTVSETWLSSAAISRNLRRTCSTVTQHTQRSRDVLCLCAITIDIEIDYYIYYYYYSHYHYHHHHHHHYYKSTDYSDA